MPRKIRSTATERTLPKHNQQMKAKVGTMNKGTVGSQLKKDISGAMGKTHRVG